MPAIKLPTTNLYSNGVVKRLPNGKPPMLVRTVRKFNQTTQDKFHEVVEGDELAVLAARYYDGNSSLWWVLADANNIRNPLAPIELSTIRIPNIS